MHIKAIARVLTCRYSCTVSIFKYFSFIDSFNVFKVHVSCFSGKLVPFNDCRRMKVNYTFSDPTAFQFNRGILNFETNPVSFKFN